MDQKALRFFLAGAWAALLSLQGACSFVPDDPPTFLTYGVKQTLPEDAAQEQVYYLQQLFGQYGENGTLSFEGLTRLLLSLGLGKVQVVEIEHDALGHGHVSHLDILEVQENKHLHFHSALEHLHTTEHRSKVQAEGVTPRNGYSQMGYITPASVPPALPGTSHVTKPSSWQTTEHPGKGETSFKSPLGHAGLNLLERVIALDHSVYNHLHEDCLNVSQLLVNFGLNPVSKITPEQFTLLCPALLYQIDSRVCIQHYDEVVSPGMKGSSLWPGLGWGFAAVTLTSLPLALAIVLVPLLSSEVFRFLLSFLVALAVGTLCGDALLHLWPHAQERPHDLLPLNHEALVDDAALKGLCVLGGIYLLFLIENLMGTLRKVHRKQGTTGKPSDRSPAKTEDSSHIRVRATPHGAETESLTMPEGETGTLFSEVQDCAVQIRNSEDLERQAAELHHHGHSHSPAASLSAGIADIAWMVILGDGIHNFTDGLAIGAAFSDGVSSGLSTTVAVFCHELPHELGDCAVLLQAGIPLRKVFLFNLLSAFLAYCGTVVGTLVSKGTSEVTSWIFAITAGIFLYVALVDMLPELLQRRSPGCKRGSFIHFFLQNLGFLLGGALMLCIAIFEGQISFHVDW
uniref:zinc transporter ZIP5 n=1 Tax=Euleptes europaea TaxID=460621 RepID=UPI002541D9BA|nr:zinc transporter ZIP5 [Euleptes europaea]